MSDRRIEYMPLSKLKSDPRNPKDHDIGELMASISRFGFNDAVIIDERTQQLVSGHGRIEALRALEAQWKPLEGGKLPEGLKLEAGVWCVPVQRGWASKDDREASAFIVAANRLVELGGWVDPKLETILIDLAQNDALEGIGYDAADVDALVASLQLQTGAGLNTLNQQEARRSLQQRFGVPPFTVLDARQGYWRDRKRAWLGLGIKSEEGRKENLLGFSDTVLGKGKSSVASRAPAAAQATTAARDVGQAKGELGTSVFDPVLCELAYSWFCPKDGVVLDPFAGGSVRGIVAGILGRSYFGCELRAEQVAANRLQAEQIATEKKPTWLEGDSSVTLKGKEAPAEVDFVFSCPPYGPLERYSDDPKDLSTMTPDAFARSYRQIIALACARLKPDRFAAFVVGDYRDDSGSLSRFIDLTVDAFEAAGLKFHNQAILVTPAGTAALRGARVFSPARRLVKTHQDLLVFVKGDPRRAVEAIGEVEINEELLRAAADAEE